MPHVDRLSFVLGILATVLVWWLLRRSAGFWPDVRSFLRARADSMQKRNISAVEEHLRREIIRRSQAQHAAWTMFSLDEIGFAPRLLAPPVHIEPGDPLPVDELLSTCLSYMPDWPEFPARFGASTLSIPDVLNQGINIALIGQPGSGKSFALAYLATQVARHNPQVGAIGGLFPVYLQVADLQLSNHEGADPILPIIAVMNEMAPVYVLPQVGGFIRSLFTGGNALVLLDGVDELPAHQVKDIGNYLKAIQRDYPRTRMIVTAPADYIDGFAGIGLHPLTLAAWSDEQNQQFLERWDRLWTECIVPELPSTPAASPVDPALLFSWLQTEISAWTPLEFTLKVWATYARDLKGPQPVDAIEAFLVRCVPDTQSWPGLERLALQMTTTSQPIISRHKADSWISEVMPSSESRTLDNSRIQAQTIAKTAEKQDQASNQSRRRLNVYINGGVLLEHPGDRISFNHPVIMGYLAARSLAESENLAALTLQQNWAGKSQALRFLSSLDPSGSIVETAAKEGDEPLFRGLFQAARWLKDTPSNMPWRANLVNRLVELMERDNIPVGTRQRAVAALVQSADTNAGTIFRQNLSSNSQILRQLGVLGCGALQDNKALNELINLQSDSARLVRYSACMVLAFLEDHAGMNALIRSLYEGDEDLRRAAAEALARHPDAGHAALKTGSGSDDLLVRRAVVFGLAQINEPWAVEILEKFRLEDGQWIVRSAASQALDTMQQGNPRIPHQLPPASDAGWLITFASQQGVGITGGSLATEMLLKALKSGTEDERIAALDYLSLSPEDDVIRGVIHSIYSDSANVSEAAFTTLWRLAICGATIPSPSIYGVSA